MRLSYDDVKSFFMEWHPLASSVIARAAYDEPSRTLSIEFRSGTLYEYFDVPQTIYQELVEAPSAGGYFAENIRDIYRFARTGAPDAVD